ncbi:MAG: hypothetical protein QW780_04945 [Sulfolobales archaeon]
MGLDMKKWALNWLRGSVRSYLDGGTSKKIVLGRMRKCYEHYGVSLHEIRLLIESMATDPSLGINLNNEEKRKILDKLFEEFEESLKKSFDF